jgi:hypothetical protein
VVTAAAHSTREETLWAQEVARVLEAAATFEPAARAAVLSVLMSLADDPTESLATRRDARALLAALDLGATLRAPAGRDEVSTQEPDGVRSVIKRTPQRVDSQRGNDERIRPSNPSLHPARVPTLG